MLNYLWGAMIIIGIVFAACTGRLPEITTAALDSAGEAVSLCITMVGVMSFWVGLMKIAEKAGIIQGAVKLLNPLLHFLFPKIPKNHKALQYIATNMIANFFGMGWAATPAGLKAMAELARLEEERREHPVLGKKGVPYGCANTEMCTFLIVNISSLQLIPITVIAYRRQYGSANPTYILGAAIVATIFSTIVGVIFARVAERVRKV